MDVILTDVILRSSNERLLKGSRCGAVGALVTVGANSRARDSQNGDNQLWHRSDTPSCQLRSRTIFPVNCPVAISFSASS